MNNDLMKFQDLKDELCHFHNKKAYHIVDENPYAWGCDECFEIAIKKGNNK